MPLSTHGIAIQILASIHAYHTHRDRCTTNDCKVVVSHLVRKFSEPLTRQRQQKRLLSKAVARGDADNTCQEHAVPVIVLVEKFLARKDSQLEITSKNIEEIETLLRESLLLVEVTYRENLRLSACGLQSSMPLGWSKKGSSLPIDPLARYKEAEIEIDI